MSIPSDKKKPQDWAKELASELQEVRSALTEYSTEMRKATRELAESAQGIAVQLQAQMPK